MVKEYHLNLLPLLPMIMHIQLYVYQEFEPFILSVLFVNMLIQFQDGKWTAPLHYVNIPQQYDTFNYARDCTNNLCCVGAINNYTRTIRIKTPARWTLREPSPITFLVHFIADLHQPLHSGFTHDRGGNDVKVNLFGKKTNLHAVWDSGLIKNSKRNFDQLHHEVLSFINANPSIVKT